MTDDAISSEERLHYAACRDCPIWKYTDTREQAKEAARTHAEEKRHRAFHETLEDGNVR